MTRGIRQSLSRESVTYIPYAISPEDAPAVMLPIKYHENLLLVSPCVYHLVIVYKPAGMKPDSAALVLVSVYSYGYSIRG